MKRALLFFALILGALCISEGVEAKRTTKTSKTTRSTAQPVQFMGHSLNCTAKEMRDYLVNKKNFKDVTEDNVEIGYMLIGNYAGFDDCVILVTKGVDKLRSVIARVNAGSDEDDDTVYFKLLKALDQKYGKHKCGYDNYKKDLEPYEYMLDEETVNARYVASWDRSPIEILMDYAENYYRKWESGDDLYIEVMFINKNEVKKEEAKEQKMRISNM